jgi:hypothetical protein
MARGRRYLVVIFCFFLSANIIVLQTTKWQMTNDTFHLTCVELPVAAAAATT